MHRATSTGSLSRRERARVRGFAILHTVASTVASVPTHHRQMPKDTASPQTARALRRRSTPAEIRLWRFLRDRRLLGVKFRRQMPIGRFVVDFCSPQCKLVVELDGPQHADREDEDRQRTALIERAGFRVLRIWNDDVFEDLEAVLATIASALQLPSPRD